LDHCHRHRITGGEDGHLIARCRNHGFGAVSFDLRDNVALYSFVLIAVRHCWW
jgi:hypothetical protein